MSKNKIMDDRAALVWQLRMGIDETVANDPLDRFSADDIQSRPERKRSPDVGARSSTLAVKRPHAPDVGRQDSQLLALQAAEAATTLADLHRAIEKFEGCSLKRTAKSTVFADGNPAAHVMLIGEAPGAEEDRQGKPFVGPSGHLLDKMMGAIGLTRDRDYYISNILPWRPPGNRKPTPLETAACLPFIRRHIELVRPRILVLLGATPVTALLGRTEGITRLRGQWLELHIGQQILDVMPTYHPAYLLRQPRFKAEAWHDLLEIRSRLNA